MRVCIGPILFFSYPGFIFSHFASLNMFVLQPAFAKSKVQSLPVPFIIWGDHLRVTLLSCRFCDLRKHFLCMCVLHKSINNFAQP